MDVFTLMAKIGLDSSEYDKGLSSAESKAYSVGQAIGTGLNGIGKAVIGVGKMIGGAATAASGAAIALTKSATSGYAEFEQLAGGVKKLYGNMGMSLEEYAASAGKTVDEVRDEYNYLEDAQNMVLENAKNAFKTAGMSTNEYLETATSFSAALIKGLNGDMQEAARLTDVAMVAMSDNINTFGTDAQSVQNAFQGFAKQNYTMLDNLKLGYGGTAQGMVDLIKDSGILGDAADELTNKNINEMVSFDQIVEAIQRVQEQQGIANTTMKEGASTVSGSVGMVKAAWKNLIAGLADDNADLDKLIDDVVTSAEGAFKNLLPVAKRALKGIADFIGKSAPILIEKIPELITDIVPSVVEAASAILDALVQTLPSLINGILPVIIETGGNLVSSIADGIEENLIPMLFAAGDMIEALLNGLLQATEEDKGTIMEVITTIIDVFAQNYASWIGIGIQIITNIIDGITEWLPYLMESVTQILEQFGRHIIENAPALIESAAALITSLVEGIQNQIVRLLPVAIEVISTIVQSLVDNADELVTAGLQIIITLVGAIIDSLPLLVDNAANIIDSIVTGIVDHIPEIIDTGIQLIEMLIIGIVKVAPKVVEAIAKIAKGMINAIIKIDWADVGKKTITKIHEGIEKLKAELPEALKKIGETAREFVENIDWVELGKTIIRTNIMGLKLMFYDIPKVMLEIGNAAVDAFLSIDWLQVGSDIINGIVDGIKGMGSAIWDALKEGATGAWNGITDFFEISSPSKKMKWVGKMIDEGLAEGIENNSDDVQNAMDDLSDITSYTSPITAEMGGTGATQNTQNNSIVMNIYGAAGQDVDELAEIIAEKLEDMEYRQQAAWGLA